MVWHEMSCVFRALHSCLIVSQSAAGRIIAMIRRRPFVQTRESSLFSSFWKRGEVKRSRGVINLYWISLVVAQTTQIFLLVYSLSLLSFCSVSTSFFSCNISCLSFASSLHPSSYLFFFCFYFQTQWHPHTDTQIANFEVLMKWQLHTSLSPSGFYWRPCVAQ